MPMTRQLVRRLVPRPIRATYWRLHDTRQKRRLFAGRSHEPEVCQWIKRLVQPDAQCVDVGANIGLITILLAIRASTRGHVYAFEPHPANLRKIADGLARHGLDQ